MTDSEVDPTTSPARPRWVPWVAATAVVLVVVVAAGVWHLASNDHHHRDASSASMAQRAQQVMPFDLTKTTHTFTKTSDGGVQKVVVNDPSDTRDLALIRAHLHSEAQNFRSGNYSDPAKIHGMNMPGVNELTRGASKVKVDLVELPNGAQITYTSTDPALVSALHSWFDRQASDHAMPGMGG